VKDFRFHDTRHTAKTSWARQGIPVEAAMLEVRHKRVQMHQAYVHLQASDIGKTFGTAPKIAKKNSARGVALCLCNGQ
jgi:integrase